MERYTYVRAQSVAHAVALLAEPGMRSRPLAGGTDLLLQARVEPSLCDRVVDISLVPELHTITRRPGQGAGAADTVTIGAAASFAEVVNNPIVRETAPVLVQACGQVGATQVRNMGTIGGNVANAAACADSLPALVSLDAVATVITTQGESRLPVCELVLGPNRTQIPAGGLLVSLSYAVPPPGSRSVFIKLGRRNAMAISRLTVAVLGRVDELGRIAEARLVPGAATPQIRRFRLTEEYLCGRQPTLPVFEEAATKAVAEMASITGRRWSSEYKESALHALVMRALQAVFGSSS